MTRMGTTHRCQLILTYQPPWEKNAIFFHSAMWKIIVAFLEGRGVHFLEHRDAGVL